MGATTLATAAIGVMVERNQIYKKETEQRRVCHHQERDSAYCPECGKPMWFTATVYRDICSLEIDKDGKPHIEGLMTAEGFFDNNEGTMSYVFGFCTDSIDAYDDPSKLMLPLDKTIREIRDEIRAKLEPLGLFSESRFGLWVLTNRR